MYKNAMSLDFKTTYVSSMFIIAQLFRGSQ